MTKRVTILERPVKHCDMSCSGFSVLQRVITRLVLATADPPVQIGRRSGRQDDKKTNRARVRVQVLARLGLELGSGSAVVAYPIPKSIYRVYNWQL